MTTELRTILIDTPERYEFILAVAGALVRVVITAEDALFGYHAVVVTGDEYPPAEAYLLNSSLFPLPEAYRGNANMVARHRFIWKLASDLERRIGETDAELLARWPEPVEVPSSKFTYVGGELEPAEYDEALLDAQAAAEVELDRLAEVAFAEDLERRAAAGTWWGSAPDGDDLPW